MKLNPLKFSAIDVMIAVAVVSTMLGGCVRREEAPPKPTNAETIVDIEAWGIRKVCIDGTAYLLHSHTLVVQQKSNGDLIACEVPSGKANF